MTLRKLALIAGISLLVMALLAGFAYGFAWNTLYAADDPGLTLYHLQHSNLLFRCIIFSFVVILILDIVVAWSLYLFFKETDEAWSLLAAWFRLAGACLLGVALLNLSQVQQLLNDPVPNPIVVMNSLQNFLTVWSWGLIVFACHLLVLGYLVLTTTTIPKVVGILTVVAALCYLFTNALNQLWPDYKQHQDVVDMLLSLPMALGELGLAVWMIWKGRNHSFIS